MRTQAGLTNWWRTRRIMRPGFPGTCASEVSWALRWRWTVTQTRRWSSSTPPKSSLPTPSSATTGATSSPQASGSIRRPTTSATPSAKHPTKSSTAPSTRTQPHSGLRTKPRPSIPHGRRRAEPLSFSTRCSPRIAFPRLRYHLIPAPPPPGSGTSGTPSRCGRRPGLRTRRSSSGGGRISSRTSARCSG